MPRLVRWVLLVSGTLTMTMVQAALWPQRALVATFGEGIDGPVADLVVRSWGTLITLVGVMLVYGAFRPAVRSLVLMVASASKIAFIGLVMSHGSRFLGSGAGVVVAVDSVMVVCFVWFLIAASVRTTT